VLKEYRIWHFFPQSGVYGRSGIPDIIGILPGGVMLAIEVKAGKKYGLTALQEKTLHEMSKAGAHTIVVDGDAKLVGLRASLKFTMSNR
jgi:hypothetical protein